MNPFKIAWWRQLRVRLAVGTLLTLVAMGLLLNSWSQQVRQHQLDGYQQWLDAKLAQYIASRRLEPWLDAQGHSTRRLMRDTAMYASMIRPSLEIYLLDAAGHILDHTLDHAPAASQVALEPLQHMLEGNVALPIYGPDPRVPGAANLFSVARIEEGGHLQGYLYVVLRGKQSAALARSAAFADQLRGTYGTLVLALGGALLLMVWVQSRITRRLQALMQQLLQFRDDAPLSAQAAAPFASGEDGAGDELDVVAATTRQMQYRIDAQFKALEQADSMRRDLISNITHDLHTPLASIQGYIETVLLHEGELSAQQRAQHLHTSLRHCQHLANRVSDLFELSKLESGQTSLALEPFCLAELLNDMVQRYQLCAQQAGVALRLADDVDRQAKVMIDIALIERVFQNLIDNALRHTPQGGSVLLSVRADLQFVEVTVRDTGHGIDEQDLPHIFERFWSKPGLPQQPGAQGGHTGNCSGLGLAIVNKILTLHGSLVRVRSDVRSGTEFSFTLARAPHYSSPSS